MGKGVGCDFLGLLSELAYKEDEVPIAVWAAFMHNQMRGFQKKPFLMMESTPSLVNWDEENNVKDRG